MKLKFPVQKVYSYQTTLVMISSLLAFWPVIFWYINRLLDGSDEKFGILAFITAIIFLISQRTRTQSAPLPLILLSLIMLIYIISYIFIPPMLRAAIAITLLGVLFSHYFLGRSLSPAFWGLLLLSLPLMASLQFYAGYPLRWLVGNLAAHLLQLNGLAVTHTGTLLNWSGGSISIDAPCSGIKMMWFGFYLSFTLACFYNLKTLRFFALSIVTLAIIIAANTLRTSALFYIESGIVPMPAWAHDGVGVISFLAAAIAILWQANKLMPKASLCSV